MASKAVLEALLEWVVPRLDTALTGHALPATSGKFKARSASTEDLVFGDIYYLSDGGYSRIVFILEAHRLVLCSEPRPEVKAKWDDPVVAVYRQIIEDVLTDYVSSIEKE